MPQAQIHPSAIISEEAEIGPDVQIGPYVVIEGPVKVGAGCILKPYVHLVGPLTLGRNNRIYSGTVIGEEPQHQKYRQEATGVEIGDDNVIREHCTIHRGTNHSWVTRLGSGNFLMAHAHIAHDCQVGDNCIFTNGALLGGHCVVEDNVYISGNAAVHQFMRLGRLCLLSGLSAATKDIPPFVMIQGFNCVSGVNVVGMRRAGIASSSIDAVRRAYHLIYKQGHTLPHALAQVEHEVGHIDEVAELVRFIRASAKGISLMDDHIRFHQDAA